MSVTTRIAPVDPDDQAVRAFRPDIQALRAYAVAAVVAFHAGAPGLEGGFTGVDVFFVISGFLITGRLLHPRQGTSLAALGEFFAYRIVRLLPVATLVTTTTVLVATLVLPPLDLPRVGRYGAASASYVINVVLALNGTDYFSDRSPTLFQHYWSLAVEEQFYVLWPLLVLGAALLARRSRSGWVMPATIGAVTVVSFAVSVVATATHPTYAFYLLPTRAWEFGVGGLLAVLGPRLAKAGPSVGRTLRAGWPLGVLGLLASLVLIDDSTPFPGYAAAVPVMATALIILAGTVDAARRDLPSVVGRWAPIALLGAASYSVYLWHWPVLQIPLEVAGDTLPGWERGLLVTTTLLLAWLSYTLVENPVRRARYWKAKTSRAFVMAAVLTLVGVGVSLTAYLPRAMSVDQALPEWPAGAATAEAPAPSVVGNNLTPTLRRAVDDTPQSRDSPCMAELTVPDVVPCEFGDPDSDSTVVLFGDSHAQQWLPAVDEAAASAGLRLVTFFKSSCPAASVDIAPANDLSRLRSCRSWRAGALDAIRALDPVRVILGNYTELRPAGSGDPAQSWATGVAEVLDQLKGVPVVVLGDGPRWDIAPASCLSAHLTDADTCTVPVAEARGDDDLDEAIVEAAENGGAELVDTVDLLCPKGRCPALMWNVAVYRDDNHVTATFADHVAPFFEPLVAPR